MTQESDSSLIAVEIFGETYNVRGEEKKAYIEELARFVDARMKVIADSTGTRDSLKVAILAALNISDEFFKLERQHQETQQDIAKRAGEWIESLDEALEPEGELPQQAEQSEQDEESDEH